MLDDFLVNTWHCPWPWTYIATEIAPWPHGIDGLVQERRNSIANALVLRLSCTNPSVWLCIRWLCSHILIFLYDARKMDITILTVRMAMMDHRTELTKSCAPEFCREVIFCHCCWFQTESLYSTRSLNSRNLGKGIVLAHLKIKPPLLEFCRNSGMALIKSFLIVA